VSIMSQDLNVNSRENSFASQAGVVANNEKIRNNKLTNQEAQERVNLNEKTTAVNQGKTDEISNKAFEENISEEKISEAAIQEALDVVSEFMSNSFKHVGFSNDSSSGKTIIKVIDKETQELISQFPSDKMLTMAEKIKNLHQEIEGYSGLLVDSHV